MSKVSNALSMLALLKSRGQMNRNEIAEELECDKREISRYKNDLQMAGVRIREKRGKYGGYVLEGKDYLLSLDLTDGEYLALNTAKELMKHKELVPYEDFKNALIKINSLKNKHEDFSFSKLYIKNTKSHFDYNKERKIWLDINASIITNKKIELEYGSVEDKLTKRIIWPYGLYQYDGAMYFVAFCELRKEIRQFKLSRIKEYKCIDEKFEKDKDFNLEKYLDNTIGIYKDGEIELELKIFYPYAQIIKEKQWVESEVVEDFREDNYIIYKAKMCGETEIKGWVLGMGSNVEVLKPIDFKDKIKEELIKNLEFYK